VPDPLGGAWDEMVRVNRRLQAKNDPLQLALMEPVGPRSGSARPAAGTSGPLTGRPGVAEMVAGTLNVIASGPNTSGPLPEGGTIRRGPGRDIHAGASFLGKRVGADGVLDPASARAEISASQIKGRGVRLPSRARIYNTPSGELRIELPEPIRLGPFSRRKGTYVIGNQDPPKRH